MGAIAKASVNARVNATATSLSPSYRSRSLYTPLTTAPLRVKYSRKSNLKKKRVFFRP